MTQEMVVFCDTIIFFMPKQCASMYGKITKIYTEVNIKQGEVVFKALFKLDLENTAVF